MMPAQPARQPPCTAAEPHGARSRLAARVVCVHGPLVVTSYDAAGPRRAATAACTVVVPDTTKARLRWSKIHWSVASTRQTIAKNIFPTSRSHGVPPSRCDRGGRVVTYYGTSSSSRTIHRSAVPIRVDGVPRIVSTSTAPGARVARRRLATRRARGDRTSYYACIGPSGVFKLYTLVAWSVAQFPPL